VLRLQSGSGLRIKIGVIYFVPLYFVVRSTSSLGPDPENRFVLALRNYDLDWPAWPGQAAEPVQVQAPGRFQGPSGIFIIDQIDQTLHRRFIFRSSALGTQDVSTSGNSIDRLTPLISNWTDVSFDLCCLLNLAAPSIPQ